MNRDRASTYVLAAWVGMIIIITARQLLAKPQMPNPSTYLASGVLYSLIWVGSLVAPPLAVVVAWGTLGAALFSPYLKGSQSSVISNLTTKLDSISGGTSS